MMPLLLFSAFSTKLKKIPYKIFLITTSASLCFVQAFCQPELAPWGNMTGIRIDGQLMDFETKLSVVKKDWGEIKSTGKEMQRPKFLRAGNQQIVTTNIDSLSFTEKVTDIGKGVAKITVEATTKQAEELLGIFLSLSLPDEYANATVQINNDKPASLKNTASLEKYFQSPVKALRFVSSTRQLELSFPKSISIIVKKETNKTNEQLKFYIPIQTGNLQKGQTIQTAFSIKAAGTIDRRPILLQLNTNKLGNIFDGFGGNFRLQNAKTDPQVIDYCLANLRVAWGRVEMPWRFWQPEKNGNPTEDAKNGKLQPNVQKAMEMAQRLGKMGIPFVLSAWSAPAWAIVGKPRFSPGPENIWGNPLDKNSMEESYKSITEYILYLKNNYGVEPELFSFNESDLGINIRLTGEEHAELIKGLGAYFAKNALKTKMLLGDNSDATTYNFIYPALNDPSTYPFVGAVSFHSWRGWSKEILQQWADAATKINRPLLVGEGSIDAQAWGYPAVFEEPTYALQEINLYIRLLAICQPLSILQWQLTADYSPLVGGGIFGNDEQLRPTQRFWNLKQLASTPKGLRAMPIISNRNDVSCAALGDNDKGIYAIHLVNNAASRQLTLSGIPSKIKSFKVLVTDKNRSMQAGKLLTVTNGQVSFTLDAATYTTLMSE